MAGGHPMHPELLGEIVHQVIVILIVAAAHLAFSGLSAVFASMKARVGLDAALKPREAPKR